MRFYTRIRHSCMVLFVLVLVSFCLCLDCIFSFGCFACFVCFVRVVLLLSFYSHSRITLFE